MSAPSDPRPLTGEPLPLDLVNTRWLEAGDTERDLFDDHAAATSWARSHGQPGALGPEGIAALRVAREAIAAVVAAPDEPSREAVDALNDVLAHGHLAERLGPDGAVATDPVVDEPHQALAWQAAHELLGLLSAGPDRVRHCDADDCLLVFHDGSRTGRRRWCSMQTCGNREKARRHYARVHRV